jgi:hypothetical protein
MVDGAFDAAKKAMNSEDSMASLIGTLLSSEGPKEMTREKYEYTIKWAAGSLYGGTYASLREIDHSVSTWAHECFCCYCQLEQSR